ncbi:hypothetical protein JZU54_04510, partial [bacterium]|nr:hypothetical protein [bacterium]
GTFSASGNTVYIGLAGGTGAVNVNGGSFAANNVHVGWASSAPGAGTLNLNGGAVAVSDVYLYANGKLQLDLKGASNTMGLMHLAERIGDPTRSPSAVHSALLRRVVSGSAMRANCPPLS